MTISKTSISLFAVLLGLTCLIDDVSGQQDERRFSILLHSGASFATDGQGSIGPLAGDFNVESLSRPVFGGGFQYAISPAWAIEGGFQTGRFENRFEDEPFYQTDFTSLSFRAVTNFNNLFNFSGGLTHFVNPYLSVGAGGVQSSITTEDLDSRDLSLSLIGGLGLSLYITPWLDLFGQYDYHYVMGDLLDGVSEGGSDQYTTLHGGIRINFGRSPARLASWPVARVPHEPAPEPEPEPVPVPEPEPEPEPVQFDEDLMEWWANFERFIDSPLMQRPVAIDRVRERITARLEEQQRRREVAIQVFVEEPESGHYIQIYSFSTRERAENIQSEVVAKLQSIVMNPEERVIITPYREYFRVLIGDFEYISDARQIRNFITDMFDEAFLITYPRPVGE